MEKNVIIKKIIESSAKDQEKKSLADFNPKSINFYKRTDLYVDKKVSKINHGESATFYTDEYIKLLKELLGTPAEFKKKSAYDKRIIQEEILHLSEDDFSLKTYLHKSVNEVNNFHTIFPSEFDEFDSLINKLRTKQHSGQRGYLNRPSYKLANCVKEIHEILKSQGLDVDNLAGFSEEDALEITDSYLTAKVLFNKISTVFIKIARDRMFNNSSNVFDEKALYVYNHEAVYKILDHMVLVTMIDAVVYKVTSKKVIKPLDAIVRSVKNQIICNQHLINNNNQVKLYKDHLRSIISCYTSSGLFEDVEKTTKANKTSIKYRLPSKLTNSLGKFTVPPRIVKPDKVTVRTLEEYQIPSQTTSMKIVPSQDLLDSLNTSNGKRFRINQSFVTILNMLEQRDLELNYPIEPASNIFELESRLELFEDSFSGFKTELLNRLQVNLVNFKLNLVTPFQYRYATNLTVCETRAIHQSYKIRLEISEKVLNRKAGLTRLSLSKLLTGFPLYYTTKLCTTTRQFVKEYLLSRHIGCLKLLRCDYTPKKITKSGLIYLLKAYYCDDQEKLNKLEEFLLNNPVSNRHVKQFYENNRIDYASKESLTHYMLLSAELQKVFTTEKTSILLQLDQVASGLVFMSFLFKNKSLAKQCFVVENENCVGAYKYAQDNFKAFFDCSIELKNDKVLDLFVTDRKIHKYALMCYSYKQSAYGRTKDFVYRWKGVYKTDPNREEWNSLNEVSIKYSDFINKLYPGLDSQIIKLDQILELVVDNSGSVRVRSIDGDIIEWSFYKTQVSVRKALNPVRMTTESYRLHTLKLDDHLRPAVDLRQFKVKFLSYIVHSVDASIMRRLVNMMYREFDYKIDQLHDCIMASPNQIDNVYDCLNRIYNSRELVNFMEENVFKTFMQSVSQDKKDDLQSLIDDFNSHNDVSLEDDLKVDVRKMYEFED